MPTKLVISCVYETQKNIPITSNYKQHVLLDPAHKTDMLVLGMLGTCHDKLSQFC